MKLAIFGASGRIGQYVLQKALAQGHTVTALARTPSKITLKDDRLTVIQGNVQDSGAVDATIAGAEAVISTLGPGLKAAPGGMSRGAQNIVAAMQRQGLSRLIWITGTGVADPADRPQLWNRLIRGLLRLSAGPVLDDSRAAVNFIRASALQWTVVRLPLLTDTPGTGQVRVGRVGQNTGLRISREDVADFLLSQLHDPSLIGQAPMISN